MKKFLACLTIAALLVCAGCGAKTPSPKDLSIPDEQTTTITAADFIGTFAGKLSFDDTMTLVDAEQAKSVYGILDEDGYTGDCALYISTMATPEEFALFEADDTYSVEELTALAEARIAQQKESYASYAPAEMPKLESAVVRPFGDFVLVCVCADNDAAAALFDTLMK